MDKSSKDFDKSIRKYRKAKQMKRRNIIFAIFEKVLLIQSKLWFKKN